MFKNILAGPPKTAAKTIPSGKEKEPASDEAGDAWEAAQHILQAINFGSLQTNAQSVSDSNAASTSTPALPAVATLDFNTHVDAASSSASTSAVPLTLGEDGLGRATLTDEERASLQAQLALLAAQLSEIASGEDDDDDMQETSPATVAAPLQQQHPSQILQVLVAVPTATPVQHPPPTQPILMDINQFPEETMQVLLPQPPAESTAASTNDTSEASGPSALPQPSLQSSLPPVESLPTLGPSVPPQPQPQPEPAEPSQPHQPVLPSPLPQSEPQLLQEPEPAPVAMEEESDEDEDMEMVDVDSFMQSLQG